MESHNDVLLKSSIQQRIFNHVLGKPRDLNEPTIFHKLSLIPILAWVGLGADGLSSSSYGPEEAFRTLGSHTYLALFLAIAMAFTVMIISYSYSRIIEHFPHGGGGYIVATHTIGSWAGLTSGAALLVDYVLTITVSIASCSDAIFSFLPMGVSGFKMPFAVFLTVLLVVMNLRGVKESVTALAPVFMIFLLTHLVLLLTGIGTHFFRVGTLMHEFHTDISHDLGSIGFWGIAVLFLRAFSMGGGTYTGLEAVSNGMQIIREPKVDNGKKTMLYMAVSLALTAGGLILCYLLFDIRPVDGKTMNAVLSDEIFGKWPLGGLLSFITIFSEGVLLLVAAQAGFIDGPRVMSNMAIDQWLPRRFASLSERLTMQNGVFLIGLSSLLLLVYTRGSVARLVVMYSINVFITFSLSQFGMVRFFLKRKATIEKWKKYIAIHSAGLALCLFILAATVIMKFREGGWITLLITCSLIAVCVTIKRHYGRVRLGVRSLDEILMNVNTGNSIINNDKPDHEDMTAILLTNSFSGFGMHTFLSVSKMFPKVYKNFVFVSIGEIDSGSFKGIAELDALKQSVESSLKKYTDMARALGFPADFRMGVGTDVVETATSLCTDVAREYPRSTVFAGKLIFLKENMFHRILHNETAYAIQRRLQWKGLAMMILPIRVAI
jgi:amino acid transporter